MSYFGSIYADQELSHRAKTVYMYLKDRSNADGTCWPAAPCSGPWRTWSVTGSWSAPIASVPTAA